MIVQVSEPRGAAASDCCPPSAKRQFVNFGRGQLTSSFCSQCRRPADLRPTPVKNALERLNLNLPDINLEIGKGRPGPLLDCVPMFPQTGASTNRRS